MRDLVFVDVETTGLDAEKHELLEIAAVRVNGADLTPLAHLAVKVTPEHISSADPKALAINGYSSERWLTAKPLVECLRMLAPLLAGAIIAGHNIAFDLAFLRRAFLKLGMPFPEMDYHQLDTVSLAFPLYATGEIDSLSLDAVCQALGEQRLTPHDALSDAMATLSVARKLVARSKNTANSS